MFRPVVTSGCLAIAFLSGCGNSSTSSARSGFFYDPGKARVPSCAHAGKAIRLPNGFPTAFPFIVGTTIDRTRQLRGGLIGIYGYVPSKSYTGTVRFFRDQVKQSGFSVLDFQADAPHDSEGTYRGYGRVGRWQIRSLPGCSGAMKFAASAGPSR